MQLIHTNVNIHLQFRLRFFQELHWQRCFITCFQAVCSSPNDASFFLLSLDSLLLTFEEDDPPEPLELGVKQVVSIVKSAQEKVKFCFVSVAWFCFTFWAGNVNFSY